MFFYKPSYLEADFDDSLSVSGELCTLNYNSTTPTLVTVNINTLDFKSNMKGLSDSSFALEFSNSLGIKKGDYLTTSSGDTYLVNWNASKAINCTNSQVQLCSKSFDFERWSNVNYDSNGNITTPCIYESIVEDIRGYASRYSMSSFNNSAGDVGIVPSEKIMIGIQYNPNTALIKIVDEFEYAGSQYVIIDIDYSQLNTSSTNGILQIYAQVLEGGRRVTV